MQIRLFTIFWAILLTAVVPNVGTAQVLVTPDSSAGSGGTTPTVLTTTVRRVVLDVSVTDAKGLPVAGLTAADFTVTEDGKLQRILTFDANGFSAAMDYLPPALPAQPGNTFINLPKTPEKGPLYVLLYDLVNMDSWDQMNTVGDHGQQMYARYQLIKFIESKPEGTRFAIFVRTDRLRLVQGFTSDKALLYHAIDPHDATHAIPKIFLMAPTYGQGDPLSALYTLNSLAGYLNGLPGRKNLIWFASQFPLDLFASYDDPPELQDKTKATLNLLAHDQIAIYPVYASGVPAHDSHAAIGDSVRSGSVGTETTSSSKSSGGIGVGSAPNTNATYVPGSSTVVNGYNIMDSIAEETGGRAFYGTNDVSSELVKATASGEVYYTLTYSPTNEDYDGNLRHIDVKVARKGDTLAYRRSYYGIASPTLNDSGIKVVAVAESGKTEMQQRPVEDELFGYMEHGAPTAHQLVFVVKTSTVGTPVEGTTEEMAELATQPAYRKPAFKGRSNLLKPVLLQKDLFSFDIPIQEFSGESELDLEVAAAAYDADGERMNSFVRVSKKDLDERPGATKQPPFFRIDQALEVPLGAASVRFAVRDSVNNRIGAMEVSLPLAAVAVRAQKLH